MKKKFKALVLSCIDPRFQSIVYNFLKKKKLSGKYSSFTIAGSAIGITEKRFKNWHKTFWDNLKISIKLHKIESILIFNHCDCGAAKMIVDRKKFNSKIERRIHQKSFLTITKQLRIKYPKLKTEFFLVTIDKKIINFN